LAEWLTLPEHASLNHSMDDKYFAKKPEDIFDVENKHNVNRKKTTVNLSIGTPHFTTSQKTSMILHEITIA
jgi:hypothetical protein